MAMKILSKMDYITLGANSLIHIYMYSIVFVVADVVVVRIAARPKWLS